MVIDSKEERYAKSIALFSGKDIRVETVEGLLGYLYLLPDSVRIPDLSIKLHDIGGGILEINNASNLEKQ